MAALPPAPPPPPAPPKCFSGESTVLTEVYGRMTMSMLFSVYQDARLLARNDQGQLVYTDVAYWLHAEPDVCSPFLEIWTNSSHQLQLTPEHLIYQTDCQGGPERAVLADKVMEGDCVLVKQGDGLVQARVTAKKKCHLTGIYAPLTDTGNILVDDVLASCFAVYENEVLQKLAFKYYLAADKVLQNILPISIYDNLFGYDKTDGAAVPVAVESMLDLSKYLVHK